MRPSQAIVIILSLLCANSARAEPLSTLTGKVTDSRLGTPVEGALVLVAGPSGVEHTLTTDQAGRYVTAVRPGTYILVFVYGSARSSGRVVVEDGKQATLVGKVDSTEGETIVIRDRLRPPVPPKAENFKPDKAPPYSDRAIKADAWTRAWMLLDVSETGAVLRMKWLKRPGYDLDPIAISEIKKLKFKPAKDSSGRPIRSLLVWGIEWPAAWWLDTFVGTRSGMPGEMAFPKPPSMARDGIDRPLSPLDAKVPCAGSGPWNMDSRHKAYRDCSLPDIKAAASEPWFLP